MKVQLDCYPCFLKQAVIALRLGTKDEALRESVLKSLLDDLHLMDTSRTPAHATTFMHRRIRQLLGADPFAAIKSEYNKIALSLYPALKETVALSPDPLWTASRLAIAGNVIDFGIFSSVDIEGTTKRALNGPIALDDYRSFNDALRETGSVLYLLDNAGEAVFDRLLIETLVGAGKRVTAVVKGGAIINDCTMRDALEAGITGVCEVIGNGSDSVGTIFETTSTEFMKRFQSADIIISKGQGNFETLLESPKRIFFLFQSKCVVVSRVLGVPEGSMLLMKGWT